VQKVKQIILLVMLIVLLIVMIQNHAPIQFRFLNWTYTVSQLLVVLIVFLVGFLAGFAVAKWPRRKQDDFETTPTPR